MSELKQPTKEAILKAATKHPLAKAALKELWPGAFDGSVEMHGHIFDEDGMAMAWVSGDKKTIAFTTKYKWEFEQEGDYTAPMAIHTRK